MNRLIIEERAHFPAHEESIQQIELIGATLSIQLES